MVLQFIILCLIVLPLSSSINSLSSSDISVLKDLFDATNGSTWTWRNNGQRWDFQGTPEPCAIQTWEGLRCSSSCLEVKPPYSKCFITEIHLIDYNLTGYLPNSIGNFGNISVIDLSRNHIGGTIPRSIGQLSSLRFLHLGSLFFNVLGIQLEEYIIDEILYPGDRNAFFENGTAIVDTLKDNRSNKFKGRIPTEIGNLRQLEFLDLSNNLLNEELPSEIFSLSTLKYFSLLGNNFKGNLPHSFGGLSSCRYLDLSLNRLNGSIPDSIQGLSSVEYLFLGSNRFTGELPASIGYVSNLRYLLLSSNLLSGYLPTEIGLLRQLRVLVIGHNSISGQIPTEISTMERLEILDLELNSLSGTIPIQIGQIFSLRLIVLSFNFLSGQLPWEIGNLENLLVLLITDSLISGTLPHQLFNCSNLYDLDLSRNHIHGIIPDTLTGLKHLSNCSDNAIINCSEYQYVPNVACNVTYYDAVSKVSFFSLSLNHLSGSIPNSLTELTCLSYIDLSRNLLTGTFSNNIGNIQVLSSLILSFNSISGTIPASIASITELQELTLNNNKFVGHLPSNWSSSHRLNVLSVEDNSLSGPIPQQIGNLRKLESLAMFSNLLTGTVPSSLGRLENLLALILSSNRLHGPLTFINSSSPKLQAIDISSNKFTGQIPISLFKLPKIASISLIKNCFHGTIPEEICTFGHTLTSLGLNGLSTGDACKIPILPILHSYTANFMEGTVPTCLFSMPNLQRLQLAGNGLSGTLPNLDLISPHLEDIYIAFNRLSGTIPSCFSQASLLNFDASNNQLTGTAHGVSRYFDTNRATRGSMSLKQNRLSGPIPLSFKNAKNIDILRGNLFGCSSRHELPPNDPANATSGCGTNFINLILIVSVSLLVALSVLLIFIWQYSRTKFILGHFLEFFWDTCTKSTSRSSEKNDVELTEWRDVDKDLENSTSIRSLNNVETFYLFDMFPEIREFSKELLFVTLVLFLPLCLGLKLSEQNYTTHAQQYGLTPSIAFLTGAGSAISVFLLVVFVAFFIERRLSYFSVKTFKQFECRDSVRYSIETLSNFVTKAYSRTSFFSEQPFFDRIFCLNLLFCVFDIAFISAVNGAFVYAILTQTQDIVLLSEMCLAVVKLVWSMIVLPEVLGYINMKDTSIINGRRSTCLDLQVWLSIFNIVVSPLLAMMVDGDNCFLAAFTSSSPIESKQVYNTCKVQSITGVCKDAHRIIRTQFEPPFMYSYQCSSGLILNYVAVYIMLYTFLIAVSWTTHMYLAFVVITYPGDEVSYRERFLKCLQPESQKNAVKSRSPISSKQGAVLKSIDIHIFNYLARKSARADKYICKVVVDLVIICTFGFAYPPLGVLVVVSLCLGTLEWSLLFCRCSDVYEKIEKFRVLKYPQMRCGGAIDLLTRNRWVIITIFCWFYCFFLIDITEKCVHLKLLPWLLFVFPIGMFLTQAVLASVKEPPPRISTAASSLDLASNSDFSGSSNRSNTSEPISYTESPLSLGASRGGLAPNIILDAEVVAPGLSVGDESIRYTESPLRDVSRHE